MSTNAKKKYFRICGGSAIVLFLILQSLKRNFSISSLKDGEREAVPMLSVTHFLLRDKTGTSKTSKGSFVKP